MTMTARWGLLDETPVSIILRKPEVCELPVSEIIGHN